MVLNYFLTKKTYTVQPISQLRCPAAAGALEPAHLRSSATSATDHEDCLRIDFKLIIPEFKFIVDTIHEGLEVRTPYRIKEP